MKTLVARSAAGALVAVVAGIIMLYAPTLGGDDTGPDPDAAFLAAERLDPDSA
ncbi:MAG: hypothetical protein HKN17_05835, partial [Rhodothermales bacterium]|nr:hypothetical protein [Rhodothermales bacterium]